MGIKTRKGLVSHINPNPVVANMTVYNTKYLIGISPAGIGLYLLLGCVRSFSISIKSLIIYIALDNEQNPLNTINKSISCVNNAGGSDEISDKFKVNKKGRKINKFLVHCRTLNVAKSNEQLLPKCLTPLHVNGNLRSTNGFVSDVRIEV